MTIKQASELTCLKAKTLYPYAEKQMIPHVKLGRRVLFSAKKLEAWIEGCSIEPENKGAVK